LPPSNPDSAAVHPVISRFGPKWGVCGFWVLPIMLFSGAVSFVHEVLWTRMLQHSVGSSVFAFGIMVASFLAGIALGGAVGSVVARNRRAAASGLAISQIGVAAGGVLAWYLLSTFAISVPALWIRILLGLGVLLPLTFFIGMTFPLAVRVLADGADDAPAASARVYAWNTVGAILGALAGGFVLIPWLRYEGSIQLTVVASLALACLASIALVPLKRTVTATVVVVSIVGVFLFHPGIPLNVLRASSLLTEEAGNLEFYAVGKTADVTLFRRGDTFRLRTNGLPESGTRIDGAVPALDLEAWMSPLAVLARPDARSMLVVGLGAGGAVQTVPPTIREIDVIELEREVIEANRSFARRRHSDPLDDGRLHLIVNDARGALSLTDKHYDVIVSQPSHPWTAGASHLYTREFMRQASEHLNPGGVFVQWMGSIAIDAPLFRSLVATLLSEFSELRVYRPYPSTLLFLASDQPLDMESDKGQLARVINESIAHYAAAGLNAPEDLVAALALDTRSAHAFSDGSPLITDDVNRLATSLVFDLNRSLGNADLSRLLAPYDPLGFDEFRRAIGQQGYAIDHIWRRIRLWSHLDTETIGRLNRIGSYYAQDDRGVYFGVLLAEQLEGQGAARALLEAGLERWPDSELLLFTKAEQFAGPAEVNDLLAVMKGPPGVVFRAIVDSSQQRWDQVMALDRELAAVPWTAPWFWAANRVRADMRSRIRNPQLIRRAGEEGLALIDRALIVRADPTLTWLRARNAESADRPKFVLESISTWLGQLEHDGQPAEQSARMLRQLREMFEALDVSRVDKDRLEEVRQQFSTVLP